MLAVKFNCNNKAHEISYENKISMHDPRFLEIRRLFKLFHYSNRKKYFWSAKKNRFRAQNVIFASFLFLMFFPYQFPHFFYRTISRYSFRFYHYDYHFRCYPYDNSFRWHSHSCLRFIFSIYILYIVYILYISPDRRDHKFSREKKTP